MLSPIICYKLSAEMKNHGSPGLFQRQTDRVFDRKWIKSSNMDSILF